MEDAEEETGFGTEDGIGFEVWSGLMEVETSGREGGDKSDECDTEGWWLVKEFDSERGAQGVTSVDCPVGCVGGEGGGGDERNECEEDVGEGEEGWEEVCGRLRQLEGPFLSRD